MKDFGKWHSIKSELESRNIIHLFHEREIWWCSIGENIGFEQDGKNEMFERPVLVLKKFNHDMFYGIPMTGSTKIGKYYFPYTLNDKSGSFILSQGRLLSSKRLSRKITTMKGFSFKRVKESYINTLK